MQLSKALRRLIFSPSLRAEMGEVAWQIGQKLPHWKTQAELLAASLSRNAGGLRRLIASSVTALRHPHERGDL